MANLLSFWLKISGLDEEVVQSTVEKHLKQMVIQHFDPKKADTIFSEGAVKLRDILDSHRDGSTYLVRSNDSKPRMEVRYLSTRRDLQKLFDA